MALSQMMGHYLSVKEKYGDCIVFYRLGDFYEMFYDDAVKASRMLDLTLTGKDCGLEERAPMCGVPAVSADTYIDRLVALGEKVAVCEQLEDPAEAKGLVKRDVTRVVTAGTVTSDSGLNEKRSNYLCACFKSGDNVSICWADITTGEMCAESFSGENCVESAISEMEKLDVKEIVCNEQMCLEKERGADRLPAFSSYPEYAFKEAGARRVMEEQFQVKTLDAFSISSDVGAVCACGALLQYLRDTQKQTLRNISSVKTIEENRYLRLDSTAVRNLELKSSMGGGGKKGSLLWVLDRTETAMGARLLASMITSPLRDEKEIEARLDGVTELFESTLVRESVREYLKDVKDIERISGKIAAGSVQPRDCLALSKSLSVLPSIKFSLSGFESSIMRGIDEGIADMSSVASLLDSAIDEEPPAQMRDGGYIKRGYSARLDGLRDIKKDAKGIILQLEKRERDRTGIKNLKVGYNRVFGYYIEVTKGNLASVPADYQRRQTVSNAERYTTEELKDIENTILSSEDESTKLEEKLFSDICERLSERLEDFKKIGSSLALLDVLASFAQVAKSNRYTRPKIVPAGEPLEIEDGRHPVVEALSRERFIPNDTHLDSGENRTMILTGPNMAGKSTYMRQVALITLMAHMGCYVPAKFASVPLTDKIFTRVGASDNLAMDRSTFMVEMVEVAKIVRGASRDSLIVLDEVGRGTSTYDGLAIARSLAEHITENIGAKTLFATHYHELTELESMMYGVKNYKVAVKQTGDTVVFLRKIMRGGANRSYGIEVARLAGVPREITERAKEILRDVEKKSGKKPQEEDEPRGGEIEAILKDLDMDDVSPSKAHMILSDLCDKVKNEQD